MMQLLCQSNTDSIGSLRLTIMGKSRAKGSCGISTQMISKRFFFCISHYKLQYWRYLLKFNRIEQDLFDVEACSAKNPLSFLPVASSEY
jgi:hypothetical protein